VSGAQKVAAWTAVGIALGIVAAIVIPRYTRTPKVNTVTGAVLRQDSDPRKQLPIANAEITVTADSVWTVKSDASGFFRLTLNPSMEIGREVGLSLRHPDYQPLEVTRPAGHDLHILQMIPAGRETPPNPDRPEVKISNVRVRYAVKTTNTVNVGSSVKTFEVVNNGNTPCEGKAPCSPDGRWKAALASAALDAGEGNRFRNARVSCIAGPCPFTKIESEALLNSERTYSVSVRNWSNTTTFLMEAEVIHTSISDLVRHSSPVIFGESMNWSLPATAQGPSIEAELGTEQIVFPLGPNLILSWATCTVEVAPDHTRLYRCDLKNGYRFQS
jgi:hypothetical protein